MARQPAEFAPPELREARATAPVATVRVPTSRTVIKAVTGGRDASDLAVADRILLIFQQADSILIDHYVLC